MVAAAVTGLGLATSLGFGVATTWARLLAGDSGVRELSPDRFALPIRLPVRLAAALDREELRRRIRQAVPRAVWNHSAPVCHLWLLAALEALQQSGVLTERGWAPGGPARERVGIYVGCGGGAAVFTEGEYLNVFTAERTVERDISRMAIPKYMSSSLAAQLSLVTGARGPCMTINTACSAGATALLTALDALRLGRVDCAIAGGADLPITAATLKGFANIGALSRSAGRGAAACRPFDVARDGFVLGEGAACLVLQRSETLPPGGALAILAGGALTAEAHRLLAPRPDGEGMAACIRAALRDARPHDARPHDARPHDARPHDARPHDAGPDGTAIRHVYAHATGTASNDRCEAQALHDTLPHAPTLSASKAQLGHTLGAAGAIDAVLAVQSLREGQVPPLAHLEQLDPGCPIEPARRVAHPLLRDDLRCAVLVDSFAFGGHNAALLFTHPAGAP